LSRVRGECDGARALDDVRAVSRFHRIQSSPGYDAAAAWLESRLAGLGLEVERDWAPGDGRTRYFGQLLPEGWDARRARAWVSSGDRREPLCDFEAEPLSLVQRSMPAAGRYRLVAVADGSEAAHYDGLDVRGAVVLAGAPVRQALEAAVRARGAAGLVSDYRRLVPPIRNAEDDVDSLAYTSFWWVGDEPRGWGFVVTPRVGAELRRRLAAGESLSLEVEIDARRFDAAIPLVSARLPGDTAADVLVLAHLCHPRPGAHDNGSGVAAALETARVVSALGRGRPLRRGVRFLWMPELTGTFAWLGLHPQRIESLTAALNLDMVGADQKQCGSTFLLEHPPCFAASFAEELLARIRAEALDWVTSYSGPGHYSLMRVAEVPYSGGSDHAVFVDPTIGVPCPMLIQWPDRYYHSSFDTPDRLDPRALELTSRCAATYAMFLAGAGPEESNWLVDLAARGARRRVLAAADTHDPARATARECVRAHAALRSLSRLGIAGGRLDQECAAFDAFAQRELAGGSSASHAENDRRPRRLKRGPLDFLEHLNPGWEALDDRARAEWRELKRRCPDPCLELVWFAADGRRSVGEIADLVTLETGACDAADVTRFFELGTRMGLAQWGDAGSGSAPRVLQPPQARAGSS
jgi:hypothetical protein